eukprot:g4097.t1
MSTKKMMTGSGIPADTKIPRSTHNEQKPSVGDEVTAALMSLGAMPGPAVTDMVAYNARNHEYIMGLHEQYGDLVALRLTSAARTDPDAPEAQAKTVIFTRSPKHVRDVLLDDDDYAKTWDAAEASSESVDYVHNLIQPMLSGTVFNNVADRGTPGVHQGRAQMRPTFTSQELFRGAMEAQIERAIARDGWARGGTVDVQNMCHALIRDALMVAVVGPGLGGVAQRAVDHAHEVFEETMAYFVKRYAPPLHKATVTLRDAEVLERLRERAGLPIVQMWREAFAAATAAGGAGLEDGDKKSMLYTMAKAGFSDAHMAAMLLNTIIAGAEAPASTLSLMVEELAKNESGRPAAAAAAGCPHAAAAAAGGAHAAGCPHAADIATPLSGPGARATGPLQDQLADEVYRVVGDYAATSAVAASSSAVAARVDDLELVYHAVLEGLRRFAPATLVQRVAVRDTELGGYHVPAGTTVGVCITAIHMDPAAFPDPEAFVPDRAQDFDTRMFKAASPFVTFSAGPRGCPGRHVGIAMLRVALAKLVQRFRFAPPDADEAFTRLPKFVLWQVEGVKVHVSNRPSKTNNASIPRSRL